MIEKDNIQELFSKAFENHASVVKPELWTGVQAKMAAAAGATGGAVAAKGLSVLTKWIIGSAAVTTIGVTTALVLNTSEDKNTPQPEKPETVQLTTNIPSTKENKVAELPYTAPNGQKSVAKTENKITSEPTTVETKNEWTPELSDNFKKDAERREEIRKAYEEFKASQNKKQAAETNSAPASGSNKSSETSGPASNSTARNTTHIAKNEQLAERQPTTGATNEKAASIKMANIFTPNGDNDNDFFSVVSSENVEYMEINVLDPNGKKVYSSNELNFRWDGNDFGGNPCNQGIFTYQLVYRGEDGKIITKTDFVYLRR